MMIYRGNSFALINVSIFLQNGLIRDGIMSWKSNVDKAFEGVEECYICFSIVHSSNYQLPKQSCKTCHKKFHPLCLVSELIFLLSSYEAFLITRRKFFCFSIVGLSPVTSHRVRYVVIIFKPDVENCHDRSSLFLKNYLLPFCRFHHPCLFSYIFPIV